MKIKSDFVTNSSSSSFIVILDKKPKNVEELQKILFRREVCIYYFNKEYETKDMAEIIFNDFQNKDNKASVKNLEVVIRNLVESSLYDWERRNEQIPSFLSDLIHTEFKKLHTLIDLGITHGELDESLRLREAYWGLPRESSSKEREKYYLEYKNFVKKIVKKALKNFQIKNKGKHIYIVSYSDNHGEGHLEHGDIFKWVPHIRINNH